MKATTVSCRSGSSHPGDASARTAVVLREVKYDNLAAAGLSRGRRLSCRAPADPAAVPGPIHGRRERAGYLGLGGADRDAPGHDLRAPLGSTGA